MRPPPKKKEAGGDAKHVYLFKWLYIVTDVKKTVEKLLRNRLLQFVGV